MVVWAIKRVQTYRFFGLFHASFYRGPLSIVVSERIDLILAKNLDILLGVEFLGAGVPACRARHGHFWGDQSS